MSGQTAPVLTVHPKAQLAAQTPQGMNMFFGFHDICPWAPHGQTLLALRLAPEWQSMADTINPAEICLWDSENGEIEVVGTTACWNFQQAARQQWLPDGTGRFCFNTLNDAGECAAEIVDPLSRSRKTIPGGLYAVAPGAEWGVAPDFGVLAKRWPAYGYASLKDLPSPQDPASFGITRVDLDTGIGEILISLKDVLDHWDGDPRGSPQGDGHFLTHPSISPNGKKITFLHRFFAEDEGSFTRLLVCNADGTGLRVLAEEKVSHFDWLDDETLLVWARFTGGGLAQMRANGTLNSPLIRPAVNLARKFTGRWKKRILAESYFALPIDGSGDRRKYGWPALDADGHPMVARSHDWVVTDMYPDSSGTLPLILWNDRSGERIDVARLTDGVLTGDSDAKCDLHPRWDRSETRIAVDCCDRGLRRISLFDVSGIVSAPL